MIHDAGYTIKISDILYLASCIVHQIPIRFRLVIDDYLEFGIWDLVIGI